MGDRHLFFNPGIFALGIAVGVLGLVLLLSLMVAYAYQERTLLGLAAYLCLMVVATLLGQRLQVSDVLVQRLPLVAGPALLAGFQMRLLKNRLTTVQVKCALACVALVTLGLLGFYAGVGAPPYSAVPALVWAGLLIAFSAYIAVQSRDTAGPWKWWLIVGSVAGLATTLCFLTGFVEASQAQGPVVLMLLLQVSPIYLALVWRSRLRNESRVRSMSANVTAPLTGLATSRVLVDRLMRVMSRARQGPVSSALFLIEVKNWQGLLNQLGPDSNEKMSLEAALRLRRSIGDNDLAARMTKGRFAVLAQGLSRVDEINALATRLVVSGLRIDSPRLSGVEFQFRVIISHLTSRPPLALAATQVWLTSLIEHFRRWPGSHRSRSIWTVIAGGSLQADGPKIDSGY
ncbi:MAG: diguanylate cyclase [Polaromonas sp.]|nr:diguanylate cyclase [Polaromonas sp.]